MAEDYRRAGWYPDPDGKPGERWWNGAAWSESRRGAPGAPVPLAPAPVYSADNPAPQRPDPYAPAGAAPSRFGAVPIAIDARNNRLATIGLVLGIVSLFGFSIAGPPAIVVSLLGISKARQLKVQGSTSSSIVLATIGLVAGAIGTVTLIVAIVGFFAALNVDFGS